jgi:hypothetical protein
MKYILIALVFSFVQVSGDTATFQPGPALGKDAFIIDDLPNNNYGNNGDLRISGLSSSARYFTYIEFEGLDSYAGQGHTVTSAELSLYLYNGSGTGTVRIFVVTGLWNESTITWNNRPNNEATASVSDSFNSVSGWKNYDVTSAVQDWLDQVKPNHGFVIRGASGDSFAGFYRSSDYTTATYRPKLKVTGPTIAVESQSLGRIKAVFK